MLPAEPAALPRLALAVLDDRLTEVLRFELGLVYTLDVDPVPVTGAYDVTLSADPTTGRVRECVKALVEATRTLLRDGPTAAEVEHARASIRESLHGRDAEIGTVVNAVIDELIGCPPDRSNRMPSPSTALIRLRST